MHCKVSQIIQVSWKSHSMIGLGQTAEARFTDYTSRVPPGLLRLFAARIEGAFSKVSKTQTGTPQTKMHRMPLGTSDGFCARHNRVSDHFL